MGGLSDAGSASGKAVDVARLATSPDGATPFPASSAIAARHDRRSDDAIMSGMPDGDGYSEPAPGVKLTYDDFLLFPDDGKRHGLIDGEHYVAAAYKYEASAGRGQPVCVNLDVSAGAQDRTHVRRSFQCRVHPLRCRGAGHPLHVERAGRGGAHVTARCRAAPSWSWRSASPSTRTRDETSETAPLRAVRGGRILGG